MAEGESSVSDVDAARRQNALVGYQMAISLWIAQGEQGWARFNVMLVTNSVILAAISLAVTSQRPPAVFTLLLPVVGLLFCGVWFVLVRREAAYGYYYILSARELEEKYLSDPIQTVSRGGCFGEGGTVSVEISSKPVQLRMSRMARILRARTAANLIIVVIAILYLAAIPMLMF